MAAQGSKVSSELQEARDRLGKAFLRWREVNGLSQQDLHNFSADLKVSCHNSQFAYLERGLLEPKSSFWMGLAELNKELSNGGEGRG